LAGESHPYRRGRLSAKRGVARELLAGRAIGCAAGASTLPMRKLKFVATRPTSSLLDVIMPGKSGYELCRELKEDPVTRLIPIIMITGLSDPRIA